MIFRSDRALSLFAVAFGTTSPRRTVPPSAMRILLSAIRQ